MTLERIALEAAKHGRVLYGFRRDTLDCIDLLNELGGSATVPQMARHIGSTNTGAVHQRMQGLITKGLAKRQGRGLRGDPFRFRLTAAGRALLEVSG